MMQMGAMAGLELTEVLAWTQNLLIAMIRLGAFVIAAPLFAARFVPLPVRIAIAATLGLAVMDHIDPPALADLDALALTGVILGELAIGLAAGLILQIIFAAAMMAGDWIAATGGMAFAAQVDPSTGAQTPVLAQFLFLLILCAFVGADGHLMAIALLIDSYRVLPIGAGFAPEALSQAGIAAAGLMYLLAAQFMLPVVALLLIVNIVIGVITKAAPQMNIFSFGFPLMLLAALFLLFLMLPAIGGQFARLIPEAVSLIDQMIGAARNG